MVKVHYGISQLKSKLLAEGKGVAAMQGLKEAVGKGAGR